MIFDACVLYSAPLRDLLMEISILAQKSGLFQPKWTDEIHDEWISSLIEKRPDLRLEDLTRTRELMNTSFEDYEALVTGYEHRINGLLLGDPHDRHVVAAAIECKAKVIVTANLDDFTGDALTDNSIIAQHPDAFICEMLREYDEFGANILEEAATKVKQRLNHPPKTWAELLSTYDDNGLFETVKFLKSVIAGQEESEDESIIPELI